MKKSIAVILSFIMLCLCSCTENPVVTDEETKNMTNEITTDITTAGETNPVETEPVGTVKDSERYFVYRVWNFNEMEQSAFENIVNRAKEAGFNAIKIHIPWRRAEKRPGVYNYEVFDKMVDYVIKTAGLKVCISIDMSRQWTTGADTDGVLNADELQSSDGSSVYAGGAYYNRAMVSFSSESGMSKANAFYGNAVEHFNTKYGGDILFYLPAFTVYCETEYSCIAEFDYSAAAVNGFRAWLKKEYSDIGAFNTALGTNYGSFDEVNAPAVSVLQGLGLLWYRYRQQMLRVEIDALAEITHGYKTKMAVQFGSIFDAAVPMRGTADAAYLCENVDVLWVDDSPSYNHGFSCDYALSALENIELAQEIDGPASGVYSQFEAQGLQCFAHGCKYVSVANWSVEQAFDDEKAAAIWRKISDTYIKNDTKISGWDGEFDISVYTLIGSARQNKYINDYNRASDNGKKRLKMKITDEIRNQIPEPKQSETYVFPRDYSSVQGQGGWYYREYKNGEFKELTYDGGNSRWKGSAAFTLISSSMMHPDEYAPAICFKAEADGEYTVKFDVSVQSSQSDGVCVAVFVNSEKVFPQTGKYTVAGASSNGETVTVNVKAGDMISFVLDKNNVNSYDSTSVQLEITKK